MKDNEKIAITTLFSDFSFTDNDVMCHSEIIAMHEKKVFGFIWKRKKEL